MHLGHHLNLVGDLNGRHFPIRKITCPAWCSVVPRPLSLSGPLDVTALSEGLDYDDRTRAINCRSPTNPPLHRRISVVTPFSTLSFFFIRGLIRYNYKSRSTSGKLVKVPACGLGGPWKFKWGLKSYWPSGTRSAPGASGENPAPGAIRKKP